MKTIIIGASGLVGATLLETAPRDQKVIGTAFSQNLTGLTHLDARNESAVQQLLYGTDVVLMPAAFPNVDACEQNPLETRTINVNAVEIVAKACQANQIKLVYFSSDYVFDGRNGAYSENSQPNPINQYGRQKLEAEQAIATYLPKHHLILRTTWVVGQEKLGKNFLYRAVQTLRRNESLIVPNDQIGNPTSVSDLAKATWSLLEKNANGVFHVAGQSWLSRLEFTYNIADTFSLPTQNIVGVSTASLGQLAPRPLQAGLISSLAEHTLGWKFQDVNSLLKEWYESNCI